MKPRSSGTVGAVALLASGVLCFGGPTVTIAYNSNTNASPDFKFSNVPSPSKTDAASKAEFYVVTGTKDDAAGDPLKLHDGTLPTSADQSAENFFFKDGTEGGRLVVDLGSIIEVKEIHTYSWHSGARAAQVYVVYGSDGKANNFSAQPKRGTGIESLGWKRIAKVDTRPQNGNSGGQYGVSIGDTTGIIGKYRYLLFDFSPTEDSDGQGNTYYSEIDVLDANAATTAKLSP